MSTADIILAFAAAIDAERTYAALISAKYVPLPPQTSTLRDAAIVEAKALRTAVDDACKRSTELENKALAAARELGWHPSVDLGERTYNMTDLETICATLADVLGKVVS